MASKRKSIEKTARVSSSEKKEQRLCLMDLLNNIPDAVISTDTEFHILEWNTGAERLYGWKADEPIESSARKSTLRSYADHCPHSSGDARWPGAHEDMSKPVSPKMLRQTIETVLKSRSAP